MASSASSAAAAPAHPGAGLLVSSSWHAVVGAPKKHDAKVLDAAKRRARGDLILAEWMKQGHAYNPSLSDEPKPAGHIATEHASSLSVAAFRERYEAPNLPVLINGCADAWPAARGAWHPAALYKTYRHRKFKAGEDDDGYPVKVKLKYFLRYAARQRDDSPLYIFDSMYEQGAKDCAIRHDYEVPPYFRDDLFRLVGERRRPPYRWFLVGPVRSGTGVHTDPLGTSAWNTLIYGRKRWVLFPPDVPRDVVKPKAYLRRDKGEDDEPVDYFATILPRIKAAHPALVPRMIEFTQRPGQTVYVPGGWWHAVLNLDDTVAITQNFCSPVNFHRVWPEVRAGRRGMARKWLRLLRGSHPELAAQADALNAAAGWDCDAEAGRHARRKAVQAAARAARKAAGATSSSSSDSDSSSGSVTTSSDSDAPPAAGRGTKAGAGGGMAAASSSDDDSDAPGGGGAPQRQQRQQQPTQPAPPLPSNGLPGHRKANKRPASVMGGGDSSSSSSLSSS